MGGLAGAFRTMVDRRPSSLVGWTVLLLLWPPSLVFRLAVRLRLAAYRLGLKTVYRAGVPVLSVGNLSVGGTGKTPVTDLLARRLLARGLRVAVVSRGYGGRYAEPVGTVAAGDGRLLMSPAQSGDEPYLLALRNPSLLVFVARQRAAGVRAAEAAGARVILLDDGFQHLAVHRDLDTVLLDSRAPFGNGQLLPAGPLREPPAALQRAGLVILTHAVQPLAVKLPFTGPVLHCRHRLGDELLALDGARVPWSVVAGQPFLAFAGIARPGDFFDALRERGAVPAATLALDDHQDYDDEQLNLLFQSCDNYQFCITTEKDAVKLRTATLPCRCLAVPLELEFDGGDELDKVLDRVVGMVK